MTASYEPAPVTFPPTSIKEPLMSDHVLTDRPIRRQGRVTPSSAPQERRATPLELFFDLVYVFAFTQVTHLMSDGDGAGVLRGLAVLGVLWWSWASHAWLANQVGADRGIARIGILGAIAMVFVLALSIPEAYTDAPGGLFGPLVFAVGFVLLTLLYTVVNVIAAGPDVLLRRQVVLTMTVTILPVAALLVGGALVGGRPQMLLWPAAVGIEGTTIYLTSRRGQWRLPSVAHYGERHGLVVLLALGESILLIGGAGAGRPISALVVVGSLAAVVLTGAMGWTYFGRLAPLAEQALARHDGLRRAMGATVGTYLHLAIVTGILLTALGTEKAMEHLGWGDPLDVYSACLLGFGVGLYLLATGLYWWRLVGGAPVTRLAAGFVLPACIPLLLIVPALLGLLLAAAVCAGVALAERSLVPTTD
jgi:low temperature requirement protein LtrA